MERRPPLQDRIDASCPGFDVGRCHRHRCGTHRPPNSSLPRRRRRSPRFCRKDKAQPALGIGPSTSDTQGTHCHSSVQGGIPTAFQHSHPSIPRCRQFRRFCRRDKTVKTRQDKTDESASIQGAIPTAFQHYHPSSSRTPPPPVSTILPERLGHSSAQTVSELMSHGS